MGTRHTLELDDEHDALVDALKQQSEFDQFSKYMRHLIREEARRQGLDPGDLDVDVKGEDDEDDRIQYDPYEHDADYTLSRQDIRAVIRDYEHPEIDPDHVDPAQLPKKVAEKGRIVLACYRYRRGDRDLYPKGKSQTKAKDRLSSIVSVSVGTGSGGRMKARYGNAALDAMSEEERERDEMYNGDNVDPVNRIEGVRREFDEWLTDSRKLLDQEDVNSDVIETFVDEGRRYLSVLEGENDARAEEVRNLVQRLEAALDEMEDEE